MAATLIATLCGWSFPGYGQSARVVTAAEVSVLVMYPRQVAPASVISNDDARLSAQVDARVVQVLVDVGDVVTAGAELVRLDETDFKLDEKGDRAGILALQAQLRLARAQLGRARKLA